MTVGELRELIADLDDGFELWIDLGLDSYLIDAAEVEEEEGCITFTLV